MLFIAHTVKGLEKICLRELVQKVHDFRLVNQSPKSIIFESDMDLTELPKLQAIDDLGVFVRNIESYTGINGMDILSAIDESEFSRYVDCLGNFRTVDGTFSITLSNFKNRKIDAESLKSKIAKIVARKYEWKYTERFHENFDIRISIESMKVSISVKVYRQSLFHRSYRLESQKGALRPSIAGAMVFESLGDLPLDDLQNAKVVDNFCGSGTILCEALINGHQIFGGDISKESVQIAKSNISTINQSCIDNVKVLDATNTSWPDNTYDVAISNLPWDKQIKIDFVTRLYADTIKEYSRILKPGGTLCLIGTKTEIMIKYLKKYFGKRDNTIYKLGYLGQTPNIVLSRLG